MKLGFDAVALALDAAIALRDAAKRFSKDPATGPGPGPGDSGLETTLPENPVETRLAGVVVAALKEVFDRDHARFELERAQLDEQRRRAEEAMRLELRRQAAERELIRLRLLAATALVGWVASVALIAVRVAEASVAARSVAGIGWFLLLGALGTAFGAQRRVSRLALDPSEQVDGGGITVAAIWLLVLGLAASAVAVLL